VDPADGNAYTLAEFVAQYGGTAEWDAAPPVRRSVNACALGHPLSAMRTRMHNSAAAASFNCSFSDIRSGGSPTFPAGRRGGGRGAGRAGGARGAARTRSHCRFRNTGTECISKSGMKWMRVSTKRKTRPNPRRGCGGRSSHASSAGCRRPTSPPPSRPRAGK
jgi:hypothetical protein